MRFRRDGSLERAMSSSTPRAVMLSAFTTLAAFASLSLSAHRGIHSLGLLLSISILCLVYCTIVVLPAMILVRGRRRG
jgi:predicted RND superfamily exporter protein